MSRRKFKLPQKQYKAKRLTFVEEIAMWLGEQPDLMIHYLKNRNTGGTPPYILMYLESMVDLKKINDQIVQTLTGMSHEFSVGELAERIPADNTKEFDEVQQAGHLLLKGYTLILQQRHRRGFAVNTGKMPQRAFSEPEAEKVIFGPHLGFNEQLSDNIALIRKYVDRDDLRFKSITIKHPSDKKVYLAYVAQTADPQLIKEVERRLEKVEVKDLNDVHYLEEWIIDRGLSPFPNFYYTERPDVVAANILEGRVALMTGNSPVAALLPISISHFLMAPDDHYYNPIYASFLRVFRLIAAVLAFSVSSFYVALTMVNHELLPFQMIQTIIQAREGVPFPIWIEVLILEFALELVIEASRWTPGNIGQAITLFGTIVVGQAAVQAGILNATVIVVVSLEAIASFAVPVYRASTMIRLLRYPMIILASFFGIVGILLYLMLIFIHLVRKENLGMPYLLPLAPFDLSGFKDTLIRVPRKMMDRGNLINKE